MLAKGLGQSFHQIDRSVLATCATNGDRHIAAMVLRQARQPAMQECRNVLFQIVDLGVSAQPVGHGRV
jgi:hypothetical protein